MKEQDKIKELFSEKLGNYQAPVRPELWANISSQIATSSAVSGGLSIITKTIIGFGLVATTVTAIVLYVNRPQEKSNKQPKTELVSSTSDKTNEVNSIEKEAADNIVKPTKKEQPQLNGDRLDRELDRSTIGDHEQITLPEIFPVNQIVNDQQLQVNDGAGLKNEEVVNNETGTNNQGNDRPELNSQGDELSSDEMAQKPDLANDIILPNVFSPNGDGDNDRLQIVCEGLTDFNVVILNKRNQTVFQSKDPNFSWDGTDLNDVPVESGNYVYFITAVDPNGKSLQKHNTLFIAR